MRIWNEVSIFEFTRYVVSVGFPVHRLAAVRNVLGEQILVLGDGDLGQLVHLKEGNCPPVKVGVNLQVAAAPDEGSREPFAGYAHLGGDAE